MEEKKEVQGCFPYWPEAKGKKLTELTKEIKTRRKREILLMLAIIRLMTKANKGIVPTQKEFTLEAGTDFTRIRRNDPKSPLYNCLVLRIESHPNRKTIKCAKCHAPSMYGCPLIPKKARQS